MSDLKDKLGRIIAREEETAAEVARKRNEQATAISFFFTTTVTEAFSEFNDAVNAHGYTATINISVTFAEFVVKIGHKEDFRFEIQRSDDLTQVDLLEHFVEGATGKAWHTRRPCLHFDGDKEIAMTTDQIVATMLGAYQRRLR